MQLRVQQYFNDVTDQLNNFRTVDLAEMEKAKLMNRLDNKFIISEKQLLRIMPQLAMYYSVLEINETRNHSYSSTYYDTADNDMYLNHHNRRLNRYKIRQRVYNSSGDSFLEVKFKNNKGETKKSRIETEGSFKNIPTKYFDFIADKTTYQPITLRPVLENEFYRFTLTNEKRNQRITVDTQINFWYKNKPLSLPNLAIVEIKSTRDDLDRTIFNLLKESHVHPSSMSKYCIGMAMLQPELKQNLFKRKIHAVNKICYA